MVKMSGFADEIGPDADEQIATLEATGLRFLELRAVEGKGVLDLSAEDVTAFKERLAEAGIGVSSIGSPIGKVQIRADLEEHFARFDVALQRAGEFAAGYVRVFSFYHEGEEPEACRDAVLGFYGRMVERAAAHGVVLLHENESGIYGDAPERCADLLESINSPHLRAAFDPANFVHCGVDPLADAWPLLENYTEYFHIKDKEAASGRVVPAGRGDGGVAEILTRAAARGFDGFLSIEPHLKAEDPDYGGDGPERFGKAVAGLREVLDRTGIGEA